MIASSGKTSYSYLRRICILPVSLAILFIFSISISQAQIDSSKKTDSGQLKKLEGERKSNPFYDMEPHGHGTTEKDVKFWFNKIVSNPPADRIYFINETRVSIEKVKQLKYANTTDMVLLPPQDGMKKFGVTGEKGVIAFLTKKK